MCVCVCVALSLSLSLSLFDDQAYHRSHRARGAEVDEAMLQCAGLLLGQLPLQGAPPIWRMETSAGISSWATCAARYLATDSYYDRQLWALS